jgi:hypothetical protein
MQHEHSLDPSLQPRVPCIDRIYDRTKGPRRGGERDALMMCRKRTFEPEGFTSGTIYISMYLRQVCWRRRWDSQLAMGPEAVHRSYLISGLILAAANCNNMLQDPGAMV